MIKRYKSVILLMLISAITITIVNLYPGDIAAITIGISVGISSVIGEYTKN